MSTQILSKLKLQKPTMYDYINELMNHVSVYLNTILEFLGKENDGNNNGERIEHIRV